MAQPMFSALGGMTPEQLLQRLQMAGGAPPGVMDSLSPDELGKRLAGAGMPPGSQQTLPAAGQPPGRASADAITKLDAASPGQRADAPSFLSTSPQDTFDNAPGSSKLPAPPSLPGAAPNAAPSAPAFTPLNFPPPAPYEPVNVPNAFRTGTYNTAGNSPWDRSVMATSAEDELRLRQQAAENNVLDLIRPGGIGMPGTTGPIVGLQPHEIAALTSLGGQRAENLFKGRQLAEQGAVSDRDQQLKALMANQQAQTQLGVADITGKAHVAGAQAAHSPAALKAQFAAQYLGAGKDPMALGEFMSSLDRHLPTGGGGQAMPGTKGLDTDPIAGGPNIRAGQTISGLKPTFGKVGEHGAFQADPTMMKPENIGKMIEAWASLPPEAQAAMGRAIHRGDLGAANDQIDAIARYAGQNSLMAEPPPIGADMNPPGQYSVQPQGFKSPVLTLNHIPVPGLAGAASAVGSAGNLPYNQLTVGGRTIPFSPAKGSNDINKSLGIGADQRRLSGDNAGKSIALLRLLLEQQQAQNQPLPK